MKIIKNNIVINHISTGEVSSSSVSISGYTGNYCFTLTNLENNLILHDSFKIVLFVNGYNNSYAHLTLKINNTSVYPIETISLTASVTKLVYDITSYISNLGNQTSLYIQLYNLSQYSYSLFTHNSLDSYKPYFEIYEVLSNPKSNAIKNYSLGNDFFNYQFNIVSGIGIYKKKLFDGVLPYNLYFLFDPIRKTFNLSILESINPAPPYWFILHNSSLKETRFESVININNLYLDIEGTGLLLTQEVDSLIPNSYYKVYNPLDSVAKKVFDSNGYIIAIINKNNKQISISYNNDHSIITITDFYGNIVSYSLTTVSDGKLYEIKLNNNLVYSFLDSYLSSPYTGYIFKEYKDNSVFEQISFSTTNSSYAYNAVVNNTTLEITYTQTLKKITNILQYANVSGAPTILNDSFNYSNLDKRIVKTTDYCSISYNYLFDEDYKIVQKSEDLSNNEYLINRLNDYSSSHSSTNNPDYIFSLSWTTINSPVTVTNQPGPIDTGTKNKICDLTGSNSVVPFTIGNGNTFSFKFVLELSKYITEINVPLGNYIDGYIYLKDTNNVETTKHVYFYYSFFDDAFVTDIIVETGNVTYKEISGQLRIAGLGIDAALVQMTITKLEQYETYYFADNTYLIGPNNCNPLSLTLAKINYVYGLNYSDNVGVNKITKEDFLTNQILMKKGEGIVFFDGLKKAISGFSTAFYSFEPAGSTLYNCETFVLITKSVNFEKILYSYLIDDYDEETNLVSCVDETLGTHKTYSIIDSNNLTLEEKDKYGTITSYSYTGFNLIHQESESPTNEIYNDFDYEYDSLDRLEVITNNDKDIEKTYSYQANTRAAISETVNNKTISNTFISNSTLNYIDTLSMGNSSNEIVKDGSEITTKSSTNTAYNFSYDKYRFVQTIGINNTTYITNTNIISTNGNSSEKTTSNGYVSCRYYDKYSRLTEVRDSNTLKVLNEYAYKFGTTYDTSIAVSSSLLRFTHDYYANMTFKYTYDDSLRMVSIVRYPAANITGISPQYTKQFTYDNYGRVSIESINSYSPFIAFTYNRNYTYDSNDELNSLYINYQVNGNGKYITSSLTKDAFGRLYQTQITVGGNTTTKTYTYNGLTTTIITSFSNNINTLTEIITFDKNGNIVSHVQSGLESSSISYLYDDCNRLAKETYANKTIEYFYDLNGNITSVKKKINIRPRPTTYNFFYSSIYPDQLMKYASSSENFTYDSFLNPLTFGDNHYTYTRGRLLETFKVGNGQTTYFKYYYDKDGIRYKKSRYIYNSSSGTFTEQDYIKYHIEDENVLVEDRISGSNHTYIYYYYGVTGVEGFFYNNNRYIYLKDGVNNIIAILDEDFDVVARYSYDAYGNTSVLNPNGTSNTSSTFIGNINPFRYKCYYYDIESSMYYCKSRYYVPEIRRWLNADDFSYLDESQIDGLNLFAYCKNNPLIYEDPEGKIFNILLFNMPLIIAHIFFDAIYGAITYVVYDALGLIKIDDGTVSIKGSIIVNSGIARLVFLALMQTKDEYRDVMINDERSFMSYLLEWDLHNVAGFVILLALFNLPKSSLGTISTNKMGSLLELFKSAITVDMEKSKEWFKKMWEKIFSEKKK